MVSRFALGDEDRAGAPPLTTRGVMLGDLSELRGVREQTVVDLPRVEHRLREHEAGITGQGRLVQIAPISNDAEDRKFPIMQHVAKRVARFEESRTLNHDQRSGAAEVEA